MMDSATRTLPSLNESHEDEVRDELLVGEMLLLAAELPLLLVVVD
jgi:hypothetical protein